MRSAFPLDEILNKFHALFKDHSTEIVNAVWKSHMKKAISEALETSKRLVIADIKTKIWDPTFEESKRLWESLQNRSIKLREIDCFFKDVQNREMVLRRLHCGIKKCLGDNRQQEDWITEAVRLMKEYWSLVSLSDAAKTVMILKEKLKLSGDFHLIQTIAEKVCGVLCFVYTSSLLSLHQAQCRGGTTCVTKC
jgi:hypothetical protein